jgi:hypothetical protein
VINGKLVSSGRILSLPAWRSGFAKPADKREGFAPGVGGSGEFLIVGGKPARYTRRRFRCATPS